MLVTSFAAPCRLFSDNLTDPLTPHRFSLGSGVYDARTKQVHVHFGRTDAAVAAYERAIVLLERRSRSSERIWTKEVRLELSRIFLRRGDFERSRMHTQWAVSHFPEDIDVVLHQGVRFHARGDVSRAQERFGFSATTSLSEGLAQTLAWYRAQPGLSDSTEAP